jgi:hypothetical protein
MLQQLAYLGITNAFALLRLLPRSDRDKDHHRRSETLQILGAEKVDLPTTKTRPHLYGPAALFGNVYR